MQKRRGMLALALPLDEMKAEAQSNPSLFPPETIGLPVEGIAPAGGNSGSPEGDQGGAAVDVEEMVVGLVRQHLSQALGKDHRLVAMYEEAFPRIERSIKKKSVMYQSLGLVNVHGQGAGGQKEPSVLHQLVSQTMGPQVSGLQDDFGAPASQGDEKAGADFGSGGALTSTASMTFHFAEDGTSLNVNGLRISEVSSIPFSVVGRLDDLDLTHGSELGKGAGGRVMKVQHKVNGTWHAVKEINIGSDEVMSQVKAEISVLWGSAKNSINVGVSPFVIQCHGVFFSEGRLYIAMECMSASLKDALDRRATFSEGLIRAITFQCLKGLRYLHQDKKQIHRDIKPHNILFNNEGVVKLSDFGIASDKVETLQLFQKGTFCGTLIYMSPARAEGKSYSYEADMWSLGVTLLHLALGKLTFASSIFGIAALSKNPPRLPAVGPDNKPFTTEFQSFVAQLLDPQATNVNSSLSAEALLQHPWLAEMTVDNSKAIIQKDLGGSTGQVLEPKAAAGGSLAVLDSELA